MIMTMKTALLLALGVVSLSFSGCRSVTVVEERRPVVGYTSVSYYHGRPYYYSGRTRYWGYPPGYRTPAPVYRHHHRRGVIIY